MLPYTAYLRVYQPIDSFPPSDRGYWEAYAASSDRPRRINALAAEHDESLTRILSDPPAVAPFEESGDAYLRRVNERLYVCPWQTRLRSWQAFGEFSGATPAVLSDAFIPACEAERAEEDYRAWREAGSRVWPGIKSSNWTVPLAWFIPFEDQERCLVLSTDTTRTLLYLTRVSFAQRRLVHTIATLREKVGDPAVALPAERLLAWTERAAPAGSLLELDYGGLPHLLSDEHLSADRSVAEVSEAVEALASGDTERAMRLRRRLTHRWKSVRALERAN
ncbi:hypothetical protein [Nocardiopsis sp. CNT312]|uniref:hypothetical protein n=1 Tax=Nocardiopsis sp. CNT312 TaxID=1137268 RepID=UPI00048A58B1|nr:hypothetical protein [Nocardiopsis sp. CNT312]